MSEQAGLLRAICEHPDDDTPRLIYADWLEDHGEAAKAEYIRTQIALARVPEHDALAIREARASRDRNAAPVPCPPLPPLPRGVRCGEYRRGFPWKLMVFDIAAFCREAPGLFEQAPIQALDLDARHLNNISSLTEAPWLARIVWLEFSLGRFDEKTIGRLLESRFIDRLAELRFEFEGIREGGLRLLLTSPLTSRLRALGLHSNFFVQHGRPLAEAFEVAAPMPVLEALDLSGNRISPDSLRPLIHRGLAPALHELDVGGNEVDVAPLLASEPGLPHLETLRLAKTIPGPAGVRAIVTGPNAANLRALYLGGNRLGPAAVKRLAATDTLTGLRVLDLSDNPVNDSGAIALARSPDLSGLLALNLRRTGIGNAAARELLDAPALSNLIHLDLHDNAFTPALVKEVRGRFGQFSASDPQHANVRRTGGKRK
jgi:uncharacterized protein (TIGR02996 family)